MKRKQVLHSALYQSTYLSFLFLLITSVLSLREFTRSKQPLFLLSFLSTFIATCFYAIFLWKDKVIKSLRYLDWIVTTPILLLELCILSNIEDPYIIISILFLNFVTFVFGWLGEQNVLSRNSGCFLGFLPFIFTFWLFLQYGDYSKYIPFFITIWTLYGLTYLVPSPQIQDICYNGLDIASKGIFAILLLR